MTATQVVENPPRTVRTKTAKRIGNYSQLKIKEDSINTAKFNSEKLP